MMNPDKIILEILGEFKALERTDTSGGNQAQRTRAVLTPLIPKCRSETDAAR